MYLIKLSSVLEFPKFIWLKSFSPSNEVGVVKGWILLDTPSTFHTSTPPPTCFFFSISPVEKGKNVSFATPLISRESLFSDNPHVFIQPPLTLDFYSKTLLTSTLHRKHSFLVVFAQPVCLGYSKIEGISLDIIQNSEHPDFSALVHLIVFYDNNYQFNYCKACCRCNQVFKHIEIVKVRAMYSVFNRTHIWNWTNVLLPLGIFNYLLASNLLIWHLKQCL